MNTKDIIKKYNLKLSKSLGQNFLKDESIVNNIIEGAEVSKEDLIIEIGPGSGIMTTRLAQKAGRVVAVEVDKTLIPVLKDVLKEYENVDIINQDILKVNVANIIEEFKGQLKEAKVVANLPYYITTPIIMKLLEENPGINTMVFMVQKEVAERMQAGPGGKEYGALSVAVQFYSEPRILMNVPPESFIPQPDVDSTVIRLDINKEPREKVNDKEKLFRLVKASFGQRRKTLVNSLNNSGFFSSSKEEIKAVLESLGISEKQRGEALTLKQFCELSNILK